MKQKPMNELEKPKVIENLFLIERRYYEQGISYPIAYFVATKIRRDDGICYQNPFTGSIFSLLYQNQYDYVTSMNSNKIYDVISPFKRKENISEKEMILWMLAQPFYFPDLERVEKAKGLDLLTIKLTLNEWKRRKEAQVYQQLCGEKKILIR